MSAAQFVNSHNQLIITSILFLILNIFACVFILYTKHRNWKIEKVFLVASLIFGTFFVFAIPIGQVPDEPAHFWRAFELSEFRVFPETLNDGTVGSYIPENVVSVINQSYTKDAYNALLTKINEPISDNYIFFRGPADNYSVLNYLPQMLGIWTGRLLHLPLIPVAYLSRLYNMVFCVVVLFFCIKYIPVLKKFLFLLGFSPITMQAFASVSADGSIICASTIIITFVFYMIYKTNRKVQTKDLFLLLFSCLALTISKPVYAFVCLILFFIPKERFGDNRRKIISIIIIGGITSSIVVAHLLLLPALPFRYETVNSSQQFNFIFSNPFYFLKVLFQSTIPQALSYVARGIGSSLEWFNVDINAFYIASYMMAFLAIGMEGNKKITTKLRCFSAVIFILVVVATFVAMYTQWTEVGSSYIEGVQGRYFVPIALLLPIFFLPSGKNSVEHKTRTLVQNTSLYCLAFMTSAYVIMTIIFYHL